MNEQFAINHPNYQGEGTSSLSDVKLRLAVNLSGSAYDMFVKKEDTKVLNAMQFIIVSPIAQELKAEEVWGEKEEQLAGRLDPLFNFTNQKTLEQLHSGLSCHKIVMGLAFFSFRHGATRSFGFMCPQFNAAPLKRNMSPRRSKREAVFEGNSDTPPYALVGVKPIQDRVIGIMKDGPKKEVEVGNESGHGGLSLEAAVKASVAEKVGLVIKEYYSFRPACLGQVRFPVVWRSPYFATT